MPAPRAESRTAPAAAPAPPCLREHPARSGTAGRLLLHSTPTSGTAAPRLQHVTSASGTASPAAAVRHTNFRYNCLSAAVHHTRFRRTAQKRRLRPFRKILPVTRAARHGRMRFGTERGGVRFIDYTVGSEQPRNGRGAPGRGGEKHYQKASYSRRWRSWKLSRLLAVSDQAAWVAPSISGARLFVLSRAWFAPPMTSWHSGHLLLSIAPPQSPIT